MGNWDNKVVNILGTDYNVIYSNDENKYTIFKDCNGFMDSTNKTVVIRSSWTVDNNEWTLDSLDELVKKNTRHEVLHAFLYESGLNNDSRSTSSWATNEEMVDWIAIQSPKIFKVYKELGVL